MINMDLQEVMEFEKTHGQYINIKNIRVSYSLNNYAKALRLRKGISLYEIAEHLGMDRGTICRAEMNQTNRGCMSFHNVKKWVKYLEES